jgi:hypothetical protein
LPVFLQHPAPLPNTPVYQPSNINWKFAPPKPELKISKVANKHQQGMFLKIVHSWKQKLAALYIQIARQVVQSLSEFYDFFVALYLLFLPSHRYGTKQKLFVPTIT